MSSVDRNPDFNVFFFLGKHVLQSAMLSKKNLAFFDKSVCGCVCMYFNRNKEFLESCSFAGSAVDFQVVADLIEFTSKLERKIEVMLFLDSTLLSESMLLVDILLLDILILPFGS